MRLDVLYPYPIRNVMHSVKATSISLCFLKPYSKLRNIINEINTHTFESYNYGRTVIA